MSTERKQAESKRVGPPCPTCGKPQNISGTPKDPAELAAKIAKEEARLAKLRNAQASTVIDLTKKAEEPAAQ